jgi:hypothetical protein
LNSLLAPGESDFRLIPVHFGLSTRLVGQWNEGIASQAQLPLASPHILPHRGCCPEIPLLLAEPDINPRRRVALLARSLPIFLEPSINDQTVFVSEHRGLPLHAFSRKRESALDGLLDAPPMYLPPSSDVPDTSSLDEILFSDTLEQLHLGHLCHLSAVAKLHGDCRPRVGPFLGITPPSTGAKIQ